MRKLLFYLMFTATVMAGCNPGNDEKTEQNSDSPAADTGAVTPGEADVKKTLNNIDSAEAAALIGNYAKARAGQGTVENASYLLSKRMVDKILAFMSKEGSDVDGIRFYLGKKSVTDAETMLLLVSTKAVGTNKHADYYAHDAALFDTASVVTLRVNKKGTDSGAVLYNKCPGCPDVEKGCVLTKTSLPRSYAEKMVQGFDGKNMNTDAIWLPLTLFKEMAGKKTFSGIRVYFGTYPDGKYTPNGHPSYKGRNTIVLTYVDKDGIDDFKCDVTSATQNISAKDGGGSAGPPENNGELCPDNCKP